MPYRAKRVRMEEKGEIDELDAALQLDLLRVFSLSRVLA